jgi:hypothetical protein
MATATDLNLLRKQSWLQNPKSYKDGGAFFSDTGGRDTYDGGSAIDPTTASAWRNEIYGTPTMVAHGNPDPQIRISGYFAQGEIEYGLSALASMLNLEGAAASDGAQGLIDAFGIPLTVTELRSVMGLNESGQPYTENELNKVFSAGDGGDTNNDGVVNDAELGAWRPTDGRYGTNPNNQNNYSQNTLAQILRDGGVDSDGDGVFSNEEFYDYDAMRQRRDGDSYGGVTAPGDANYQDPSTWNNPPAAELPPEQEIDNNPAPPPPPPPESSFTDFIPDSPLIDADATQVLIDRRDSESGLNLSILGILGAIFGDNLWIARSEPQLLDDVLKIFGVGVDDFYEENPTLNPESPDFVPPTNPNEEPPGEFPPDDGEEPPGEFPPNEGGEFPPNEGGEFPPSEGEFPPGEGEFPPGEDEFPPSENPDDNNDNDDDSDRGDDNGDDGMPSWLEDLLAGLLGIDRRDIPGGGTGVGIGEGGDGGDAESRSDSESTSSSDSSAESEATGGDAQATGGEATGGSADVNVEGSGSSIGDFLSQITNNFVEEAPDLVGAAAQDYLSQKYYVDALEKASDEELAFLKELMGRQDTFQIFRNLGLPAYNEDGTRLEDNTKVDYELNKLRRLVDRNLEDEYQIQPGIDVEPLIDEIGAVDPSGLGQINVADLLMNADLGQSPDAINTQVNQIDPFDSEDPALRFLQDEGRRAIESTSAAQGRLNSGGTLQELQNQAIGTAAQYAGNLADIGRLQDTSQLGADQQFYSQLLGSGEQDYSRGLGQLQAVADAQNQQDETALRGDIARFESELGGGGQQFDQSRLFNADELDREQMLYNEISGLLTTGLSGATGLTGNAGTFGTLGGGIYQEMGDTTAYQGLQKADRIGNVLGGLFNR